MEGGRVVLVGVEPGPAEGGTQQSGMDRDDGTKAAPGASNDDDVLVLGLRQCLQHLVRVAQLESIHDQILWVDRP